MSDITSTIKILRMCGYVLFIIGVVIILFAVIYMLRHRSVSDRQKEKLLKTQKSNNVTQQNVPQKEDPIEISIRNPQEMKDNSAVIKEKILQADNQTAVETAQKNQGDIEDDEDGLSPTVPLGRTQNLPEEGDEEESNMLLEDDTGSCDTEELSLTAKLDTESLSEKHRNFIILATHKSSLENPS